MTDTNGEPLDGGYPLPTDDFDDPGATADPDQSVPHDTEESA